MAGYRRNQCRRFVWLLLLIIATVCTAVAYFDSAWVVTQSSVSPSIELGLTKKCYAGRCTWLGLSDLYHLAWKVVDVLIGCTLGLEILTAVCVLVTFKYGMNNTRFLNAIKAAGGLASLVLFAAMIVWPFGLDNSTELGCTYNYPTQSYYMCDPWALGWAVYVMIAAMVFLAFSVCFSSLISSQPRPPVKEKKPKSQPDHEFDPYDQRKGKRRRNQSYPMEMPYYPVDERQTKTSASGAGAAAANGAGSARKGKYLDFVSQLPSGAFASSTTSSTSSSTSSKKAPPPYAFADEPPAPARAAPSSIYDDPKRIKGKGAKPSDGAAAAAAASAAGFSYLDVAQSPPSASAATGFGYLDVAQSTQNTAGQASFSYLDVAQSPPPASAMPSLSYLDVLNLPGQPTPAAPAGAAAAPSLSYLDVMNVPGQPAGLSFDGYFDPTAQSDAPPADAPLPFDANALNLLQSVMGYGNAGAAAAAPPPAASSFGGGFEFNDFNELGNTGVNFGTMGSGQTVFNPLFTDDEQSFGFHG